MRTYQYFGFQGPVWPVVLIIVLVSSIIIGSGCCVIFPFFGISVVAIMLSKGNSDLHSN